MAKHSRKARNIVGPQVRSIRDRKGWSQPTLATKCQLRGWDVSRDIIARIETQVRWVADSELVQLAKVLEVSPNDLLRWG